MALLASLLLAPPSVFFSQQEVASAPLAGGDVLFRTDAGEDAIARSGAVVVEAYGAFRVARGLPEAVARLESRGFATSRIRDPGSLDLAAGRVDVRELARSGRGPWSLDDRGRAVAVVHFEAPIKAEWRDRLEASGLAVLRYLPAQALAVRGTRSALDRIASWDPVDWVGPYDPAWKVRPGAAAGTETADVRIVVFPGASEASVEDWLAGRGVRRGDPSERGSVVLGSYGPADFRWIRARIPTHLVDDLAGRPEVEFIERVRVPRLANADANWIVQTARLAPLNSSRDLRYWWYGLDGRGQVVAISDTGLDYDHNQFRQSSGVIASGDLFNVTDPARRKVVRYVNMGVLTGQLAWPGAGGTWDPESIGDSDHTPTGLDCTFGHGTAVASVLTGNDNWAAGGGSVNDGNAFGAKLYLQDIGTVGPDPEGFCSGDTDVLDYLPEDYTDLFGPPGLVYEDPTAPVRIHSNSWGTDENVYDLGARMVDAFVWEHPDLTVLFPTGNAGSVRMGVGSPATAKSVVSVGGVGNPDNGAPGSDQNDVALLSSRGPTADGRIKPTVMGIFDGDSGMSDGDPRSGSGLADDHWAGTSYATPSAAAAAAIIRQYFVDGWYPTGIRVPGNGLAPTAALVRAVLIASGTQVTGDNALRTGFDTWPNDEQGFGRVTLSNVLRIADLGEPVRVQVVDAAAGLLTGEDAIQRFRVAGSASTFKAVIAWSDHPGTLGAGKALVNDLDLEVTAPDGTVYRGNVFGTFADGQSLSGGAPDDTNVEEAVIRKNPAIGVWTLRVVGANVPVGPQPYALAVVGDLDPAYGRVSLDRGAYRPGETIGIVVEDSDAASVTVRVASTFESAGEAVVFAGSAASGTWQGSVPTALGPVAADGVLQIRDEDVITVMYDDASPAHTATASARVDGVGPAIHDVLADPADATSVRIRWRTDEPAESDVRYGTSPSNLTLVGSLPDLRTVHTISLTGLTEDTLYYFDVVARDRHGHETRDDRDGQHYRFRTAATGDVLVVIGDESFPEPRAAMYAADLDGQGWRWTPWRVAEAGAPPLSLLQVHRAVVWQTGLEQYPPFNDTERNLIQAYLDGGGRLLVVSHDTAWALTDASSDWYSPQAAAWVRGVLKATLDCDPENATRIQGRVGDPISGGQTGGVSYVAHRDGGAVDRLTLSSAGGTTTAVWDDAGVSGCTPASRPVALRWVSSVPNGTAGPGNAWGGTPSRLVYYAFELTGVASAVRPGILDGALRWLVSASTGTLDRDHPDVALDAPNGGSFAGPTVWINWTASSTGAALAGFDVSVSADFGQTWSTLTSLPGTARSYAWDASGAANGDGYLVRIFARDAGSPSLSGQDESDATFAIARTGGDLEGPRIWAGSVRVRPNPAGAASPAAFEATADDRWTGGGRVAAAEAFLAPSEPLPGDFGTGLAMDAVDGAFDDAVEELTWSGSLASAPGGSCAWVHARDGDGRWGPFQSACFVVLSVGPDVTPPATARPSAARRVNGGADVEIAWEPAWDDALYGGTSAYRILRATSPADVGADVSGSLPATRASGYIFVDPNAGADASDYFYRIESVDAAGNRATTVAFAAKVRIAVAAGANLVAVPVDPGLQGLDAFTEGLAWSVAWAYDGCASGFSWSAAVPAEAGGFPLRAGQGLWINATSSGYFVAVGIVPATARVDLCAGWNLVGLPGFPLSVRLADLKTTTGADRVLVADAARPYGTRALDDSDLLVPGQGLWVHVPSAASWTVPGS